MNPLRTLRDWWHRPVLDALDRVEANTQPRTASVDELPPEEARAYIAAEMDRIAVREQKARL